MNPKPKKCRHCGSKFTPYRSTQVVCSPLCAIEYGKKVENKKWKKRKAKAKEELKTHKDYLQDLQKVFNTYIRERDRGKPCISCGTPLNGKFDAGHFYSVGSHPNLRFNENNVHGQCVYCNQHKHGNLIEYNERLPQRIGLGRYAFLKARKNDTLKLSIPELKVLIIKYKEKTKQLTQNRE
jgi:hypothetical protein